MDEGRAQPAAGPQRPTDERQALWARQKQGGVIRTDLSALLMDISGKPADDLLCGARSSVAPEAGAGQPEGLANGTGEEHMAFLQSHLAHGVSFCEELGRTDDSPREAHPFHALRWS